MMAALPVGRISAAAWFQSSTHFLSISSFAILADVTGARYKFWYLLCPFNRLGKSAVPSGRLPVIHYPLVSAGDRCDIIDNFRCLETSQLNAVAFRPALEFR